MPPLSWPWFDALKPKTWKDIRTTIKKATIPVSKGTGTVSAWLKPVMNQAAQMAQNPLWVAWLKPITQTAPTQWAIPSYMQPWLQWPTAQSQQAFKTSLDETKKKVRQDVFNKAESWGEITKNDIKYALEWLTDQEKSDALDILANSNAQIEGIHFWTEMENQKVPVKTWFLENTLWWLESSAVWLAKPIAESWFLDKPMEYLAWKIVWNKKMQEYNAKWWKPFSQIASENTLGNKESASFKTAERIWDIAQLAWASVPAIMQWSKYVAKQLAKSKLWKVLNIIKETEWVLDKRTALKAWKLLDQPTWLKSLISWWKEIVQPSNRTLAAVETIGKEISNPATQPVALYNQVKWRISEIWWSLSNELKKVGIKGTNMTTSNLKESLDALGWEIKDISPAMGKKIKLLSKDIVNAENADDFRKSLQKIDNLVPESVKKWVNLSWKDQYIYDARRAARNAGNDTLEQIANTIENVTVKDKFKTMSNLYHASWQIEKKIAWLTKPTKWLLWSTKDMAKRAWLSILWWAAWAAWLYKAKDILWL